MLAEDTGFALLNNTNLSLNFVLRLDGLRWIVPLSLGLPMDAAFYGLDAFVRRDGTVVLFVATDDSVLLERGRWGALGQGIRGTAAAGALCGFAGGRCEQRTLRDYGDLRAIVVAGGSAEDGWRVS
jgi:hypothetical protein